MDSAREEVVEASTLSSMLKDMCPEMEHPPMPKGDPWMLLLCKADYSSSAMFGNLVMIWVYVGQCCILMYFGIVW